MAGAAEASFSAEKGHSFCDRLRDAAVQAWTRALDHRFFQEVASDRVEDRIFGRYLTIEYGFVDCAAVVLGHAVAKAPDFAARRRLAMGLYGLVTDQRDYFVAACEALGISPEEGPTSGQRELAAGLHELFLSTAKTKGYEEILGCMLAAEWMYLTWCGRAHRIPSRRSPIRDWVALHAGGAFAEHVAWLRSELDSRAPHLSPDRQSTIHDLFEQALAAEVAFHDAAYA